MTDEELIKRLRSPHGGNWLTDLAAERIEQLNAKLAKAMRALKFIGCENNTEGRHARAILAELKGQKDD